MSNNNELNHRLIIGVRALLVILMLIYGWWIVTSFRTQTFGLDHLPEHIIAATIFVLPFCIIPFVGLKSTLLLKGGTSLFALIVFTAFLWGSIEEFVVTRDAPVNDDKTIVIKRWWPFENHVIIYSPEIGWDADD